MKKLIAGIPMTILAIVAIIAISVSGCSQASGTAALEEDKPPVSEQNTSDDSSQQTPENEPEEAPAVTETVPDTTEDTSPTAEETPEEREEEGFVGMETHVGGPGAETTVVPVTGDPAWTEWDTFISMSPAEQDAFMKSFDSMEEFTAWLKAAQAAWAAAHPTEEIGPGSVIDLSGG